MKDNSKCMILSICYKQLFGICIYFSTFKNTEMFAVIGGLRACTYSLILPKIIIYTFIYQVHTTGSLIF